MESQDQALGSASIGWTKASESHSFVKAGGERRRAIDLRQESG